MLAGDDGKERALRLLGLDENQLRCDGEPLNQAYVNDVRISNLLPS